MINIPPLTKKLVRKFKLENKPYLSHRSRRFRIPDSASGIRIPSESGFRIPDSGFRILIPSTSPSPFRSPFPCAQLASQIIFASERAQNTEGKTSNQEKWNRNQLELVFPMKNSSFLSKIALDKVLEKSSYQEFIDKLYMFQISMKKRTWILKTISTEKHYQRIITNLSEPDRCECASQRARNTGDKYKE